MAQEQNKTDIGGILNGILSNPQALSSIMSVIGNMRDSMPNEQNAEPPPPKVSLHENVAKEHTELPSLPAMSTPAFIPQKDAVPSYIPQIKQSKEQALLVALKPFLSDRRCETIDTFLRLLDIFSLLGRIR